MFEHKTTLVRVIHHLYVFSFQNPIWDLNNHFFLIFTETHTQQTLNDNLYMLIQKDKI